MLLLFLIEKGLDLIFEQTCIPYTHQYFVPSLVLIGSVVQENKCYMSSMYFGNYFPLEKSVVILHFNELECPSPKEVLHVC